MFQERICLVSTFCSDYMVDLGAYQWNAGLDDAVSINRSIKLIIDYFINRLIVAALVCTHPGLSHKSPLLGVTEWSLSNFGIFVKTRVFTLSVGNAVMTLALFVLIQYQSVSDGRTDGQANRHLCSSNTSALHTLLAYTALNVARLLDLTVGYYDFLVVRNQSQRLNSKCGSTLLV